MRAVARPRAEADDEIAFHLEQRTQELIAGGVNAADARAAALRAFGDVNAIQSQLYTIDTWENRRMHVREWLDGLRQDVGFAVRTLSREPSVVASIVLTLALAIGANAAMFGVVRQLMLAPPPGIANAERVARVQLTRRTPDGETYTMSTTSYPTFRTLQAQTQAFDAVAAVRRDTIILGRGASATQIAALAASGDYFSALGARPIRGRLFGPVDDEAPDGTAVVVLSHAFWQREFLGAADVLGREIVLQDQAFTVIGVTTPGFLGDGVAPVDVFIPLAASMRGRPSSWRSEDGFNIVSVVVRVRDGLRPITAGTIATTSLRNATSNGLVTTVELESVVPGASARQSPQARIALWLSGVSIVVLLIATANVATLLLLRAVRRRREIAVRIALGAGRGRLARQLFTESTLLAAIGAATGLLLSRWLAALVRATLLPNLAPSEGFVDSHVLAATLSLACIAGLLAGSAPLLQVLEPRITGELHGGSPESAGRSAAHRALVGIQVALCTVLLFGAGLFVRSLDRIQAQDLGFSTSRLLFATLDFRGHLGGHARDLAYLEAARRLETLPGVAGATVVEAMPFGFHHIPPIGVPGRAKPPGAGEQLPIMYAATAKYLDMMGVTLLEGRLLTDRDGRAAPLVVLVNETFARGVWPGERAVGKCIRIGYDPTTEPAPLASPNLPCREIVGVVRDSRARSLVPSGREASLMQYYVPFEQIVPTPMPDGPQVNGLFIKTTRDEHQLIGAVQQSLQSIQTARQTARQTASVLPVYAHVRPYQDFLDPQLRSWRLGATLFSLFGVLALAIAALGAFGVVSYLGAQRTREMGVRLALGGTRRGVVALVMTQAVRMVGVGVATGLAIAVLVAPVVRAMLFETSPRDLGVAAGAAGLLLAVTAVAAALPAWRASRVSPMVALRTE